SGAILNVPQGKAGGLNGRFIEAGWDEQEEAAGGADVQLALGDFAGDHGDVGKHKASLAAKQTGPFAQCPESIPQVQDGVDAQHGVETSILEGQRSGAIDDRKRGAIGKVPRRRLTLCVGDGGILAIYACDPTSRLLDECQRRTSGATAHVEDVTGGADCEKTGDFGVFSCGSPTFVPDVLAEDIAPQRYGGIAAERSVLHGIEVGAPFTLIDHLILLPRIASSMPKIG